jgi:hypothetical protein
LTSAELTNLAIGTLTGILSSTVFILALFLGFCIIFGFPKLRPTFGRKSMVVRSLDDLVGQESYARYLPASTPRGPTDVLHAGERK